MVELSGGINNMADKIKVSFSADEIIDKIIEKENINLDKYEPKVIQVVIPSLRSKGSLDINVDYISLDMFPKLVDAGINTCIINDFDEYVGDKNDKFAIAEHLSQYNTLEVKKEYDDYKCAHHLTSIVVYYKIIIPTNYGRN